MKVIQIMDNFVVGGGVNSFVYDLCFALKEQGVDVSLVGILEEGFNSNPIITELRAKGIGVECLGAKNKPQALIKYLPKLRALIRKISQGQPTICNLHLKLSVLMGTLATIGLKNVTSVETYHSQYSHYWAQQTFLAPFIAKYICCSESAKEEFLTRFNPNSSKVCAINNGVNVKNIQQMAQQGKALPKHGLQLLSVGRFTKQKNLHITAQAFADFPGDTNYRIVGQGILETQIRAAACGSKKIELPGLLSRREVLAEVQQADMVVMPSLFEGLSIFLLETISLGKPLMLSDIASFRDIFNAKPLSNGESWRCCRWGYLVQTNNSSAYKEALMHFVQHPELKESMSKFITTIAEQYSILNTAKQYIQVYDTFASKLEQN